jgi:hypothetical protein
MSDRRNRMLRSAFDRTFVRVREVLLRDWDPIGIRDADGPRDEYDEYAGRLTSMLLHDATDREDLARYLIWAQSEQMGLGQPEAADLDRVLASLLLVKRGFRVVVPGMPEETER